MEDDLVGSGIDNLAALDPVALGIGRAGGFADNQLGMDWYEVRKCCLATNPLEKDARRSGAHLMERLANRGEAGVVKCRALDIIEPYDGNVSGDLEAMIHQRADSSDGGNVVVAK